MSAHHQRWKRLRPTLLPVVFRLAKVVPQVRLRRGKTILPSASGRENIFLVGNRTRHQVAHNDVVGRVFVRGGYEISKDSANKNFHSGFLRRMRRVSVLFFSSSRHYVASRKNLAFPRSQRHEVCFFRKASKRTGKVFNEVCSHSSVHTFHRKTTSINLRGRTVSALRKTRQSTNFPDLERKNWGSTVPMMRRGYTQRIEHERQMRSLDDHGSKVRMFGSDGERGKMAEKFPPEGGKVFSGSLGKMSNLALRRSSGGFEELAYAQYPGCSVGY